MPWQAEDLPFYLFTFLPFYLFTFLPFYLFTFLPFYLFTFLPFYLFTFHPIHEGDPGENLDMGKCFTTSIVSVPKNVQRSRDS
jgi:hypothetical protein